MTLGSTDGLDPPYYVFLVGWVRFSKLITGIYWGQLPPPSPGNMIIIYDPYEGILLTLNGGGTLRFPCYDSRSWSFLKAGRSSHPCTSGNECGRGHRCACWWANDELWSLFFGGKTYLQAIGFTDNNRAQTCCVRLFEVVKTSWEFEVCSGSQLCGLSPDGRFYLVVLSPIQSGWTSLWSLGSEFMTNKLWWPPEIAGKFWIDFCIGDSYETCEAKFCCGYTL